MGAFDIGRICLKIAGRHAGKKVVIVSELDNKFVTIDGPKVKRKRCNIAHLEPLNETIKVTKSTTHENVIKLMK